MYKLSLEILTINVISGIVYFRNIILESSLNVSEAHPVHHHQCDGRHYADYKVRRDFLQIK